MEIGAIETLEKASVSGHARERLAERWDWNSVAFQAYTQGECLSSQEIEAINRRGYFQKNYWTRIYRKFNKMIWVFEPPKRRRTILITVFPVH